MFISLNPPLSFHIMPNHCVNFITLTSPIESDITQIAHIEIPSIPIADICRRGKKGIRFEYLTDSKPNHEWRMMLLDKYPLCWIKHNWVSEDGTSGIWIGNKQGHSTIEWKDVSLEEEHAYFN